MDNKIYVLGLGLSILIGLTCCESCTSQDISREPDPKSLFLVYTAPVIPQALLDREKTFPYSTLIIATLVDVDTNGFVKQIKYSRLLGIGNDFPAHDTLWDSCEASIGKAARSWRFKALLAEDGDVNESTEPRYARLRPYMGVQTHLVFVEFQDSFNNDVFIRTYFLMATRGNREGE